MEGEMAKLKGKLALDGGAPAVTVSAPRWPIVGELEVAWMEGVVRSGQWSWMGPHESAFCREFAHFIGAKHAICMANGTVTLQVALQAVGVRPGDEVIVPALTWVATAQAALDIGASVVLVDIDPETLCMDPRAFQKAITKRTKAVIPVHLYGCMCDMDAILEIARKHGIKVVEDVAHQHGSRWRNIGAGALGDIGSFSFQQSKVLTSGEGGAVTTNDDGIYQTAFAIKHVGFLPDLATPAGLYGHNYRLTEMQAVLLRGGLRRLPDQTRIREENVQYLREKLSRIGGPLRIARRDSRVTRQAYYALTMVYDPKEAGGLERDGYLAALNAEGFHAGRTYSPVYRMPLMNLYHPTSPVPYRDPKVTQDYSSLAKKMPHTERAVNETAVTWSHANLLGSREYLDQIVEAVRKVNDNLGRVRAVYLARKKAEEAAKAKEKAEGR